MRFEDLLAAVEDEPVFATGMLLVGDVDPLDVRKQLSRWVAAGKIIQLRRGLYALAAPYRKATAHPFLIANRMQRGSYVSLQSALGYYDMIPEAVPTVTSVTTGRPAVYQTLLGTFLFRHVQMGWFRAYTRLDLGNQQTAFIATPEKALLDLIYLTPGGATREYLEELRLQSLDQLSLDKLSQLAQELGGPKLAQAVKIVAELINIEKEYQLL
jgi:predicted transcriptional regulator of viral defense system